MDFREHPDTRTAMDMNRNAAGVFMAVDPHLKWLGIKTRDHGVPWPEGLIMLS
jgi:hypothetical protein